VRQKSMHDTPDQTHWHEPRAGENAGFGKFLRKPMPYDSFMEAEGVPVRIANLGTIWTIWHTQPSRYHWMLQFYLRAEGLALSWVGSGRLIFSLAFDDAAFAHVADRFVAAARAMRADGWWWTPEGRRAKPVGASLAREMLRYLIG